MKDLKDVAGWPSAARDGRPDSVSSQDVMQSLARICASPAFAGGERGRSFLTYIVKETLAGRAERIKAYSIATEVFGRDSSFDAQNDPIVRVEAGRIRRALEHYYLTDGLSDPLQIKVDRGGYVPTFSARNPIEVTTTIPPVGAHASPTATASGAADPWVPGIIVSQFEDISGSSTSRIIARGLTEEVIMALARFKEIRVFAEAGATPEGAELRAAARYRVTGSILATPDRVHLAVRLISLHEGSVLWASPYDEVLDARRIVDVVRRIAQSVATTLAQAHGIISQAERSSSALAPPQDWAAYQSTLAFYAYQHDLTEHGHATVREGLKETVRRFPNYATAWALLALALADEVRFHYPGAPGSGSPVEAALDAARRAVRIDSQNVRALQALMLAQYLNGDVGESLATGERARQLNPNDTYLLAEYGLRVGLSGDWDAGGAMMAEALERNPAPLRYFQVGIALAAYFHRDYENAAIHIERSGIWENPQVQLVMAAIYAQLGDTERLDRSRRWLEANAPNIIAAAGWIVSSRFLHAEDRKLAVEGIRKAGFAVTG